MEQETSIFIRDWFYEELKDSSQKYAHIIMIATKPDIIKQAPLYIELKKRGKLVILIHTGQHYDYNLSKWVLDEFWMEVDINLNIFWKIHKKYSLIIERLWDILVDLEENYQKIPIPYVHWDTLTATTADKAAFLNKFAVVHVEAWIRTFTPNKDFFHELFEEYEKWKSLQANFERWRISKRIYKSRLKYYFRCNWNLKIKNSWIKSFWNLSNYEMKRFYLYNYP